MLLLMRVEKNRIAPMTTMEPMKAPNTIEKNPERVTPDVAMVPPPRSMTMATPRLAPELIPRIEGPANGLLKAVCSINPDPAKAAPHNRAVSACGIRDSQTMKLQLAFSTSPPNRELTMALAGMSTEPKKRLAAISRRMRTVRIMPYVMPLLFILLIYENISIHTPGRELDGRFLSNPSRPCRGGTGNLRNKVGKPYYNDRCSFP